MKTLSLRPYPGKLLVCETRKEFKREYRKLFGDDNHELTPSKRGRMVGSYSDKLRQPTYIIWAENAAALAHEVAHVIFSIFDVAGVPTNVVNDEAFCYMLETLFAEAVA